MQSILNHSSLNPKPQRSRLAGSLPNHNGLGWQGPCHIDQGIDQYVPSLLQMNITSAISSGTM